MQVNVQYAREHLEELIASAQRGEVVEIACEDNRFAKLITMPNPLQERPKQERILDAGRGEIILGAGRGELVLPTAEEWRALDEEYTRMMTEDPLTTTGEI